MRILRNPTRPKKLMIMFGLTSLAVLTGGCTMLAFGPPATPPAYTEPRPEPAADGYVSHTESVLIDVPRAEFRDWASSDEVELEDLMQGSNDFPSVVSTEIVWGDWDPSSDRTGDRRRVMLDDGHYLAEEVLADNADVFRYMVWGFTSYQRLAISYAVAQFEYADVAGQTELTWTYSFQPQHEAVRPLLAGFVEGTWAPIMRETIETMREGAEGDL